VKFSLKILSNSVQLTDNAVEATEQSRWDFYCVRRHNVCRVSAALSLVYVNLTFYGVVHQSTVTFIAIEHEVVST